MLGLRKLDKEEVEKLKNLIKRQSISEEKPDKIKSYLQDKRMSASDSAAIKKCSLYFKKL